MQDDLQDLHTRLLQLRDRLAAATDLRVLDEVRHELDRLIARYEHDVLHQAPAATAADLFDRLQRIEPSFEAVARSWAELRSITGLAAAQAIREQSDVYGGWRARWGALTEVAWERRGQIESGSGESRREVGAFYNLRATVPPSLGRTRGPLDMTLALDLRYGAGLPLARIAPLLNLSPAAIQGRISDFQDDVLVSVGRRAIERQVPPGWRMQETPPRLHNAARVRLARMAPSSNPQIATVTIVPVWEDRDTAIGRPRSAAFFEATRLPDRGPRLWAAVFSSNGDVLFLPRQNGEEQNNRPQSSTQIADAARQYGTPVLADALARTLTEGGTTQPDLP